MAFRVLSPEEAMRFFDKTAAYHRGEIEKPAYIDAWSSKLEQAILGVALVVARGEIVEGDKTYRWYMDVLLKMQHKKDRLNAYWVNDIPYRSWYELATGVRPSAEELFSWTVEDTEDYLNGPGVASFVLYLDSKYVPGIMKEFTQACLRDCDSILEKEGFAFTPEIKQMFAHPEQGFNIKNQEVIETKLQNFCKQIFPQKAPEYVKRLFIANYLGAVGSHLSACQEMEFARAEAACPNFAELMATSSQEVESYLIAAQRWQIDVLLKVWQ